MDNTILLVTLDPELLPVFEHALKKNRLRGIVARSAKEGLEIARIMPVDLILLDYDLGNIEGSSICLVLKNDMRTQHIPVILILDAFTGRDAYAKTEYGADQYLTKPVNPDVLALKIGAFLRLAKTRNRLTPFRIDDIQLIPNAHAVRIRNRMVDLTFTEYTILSLLVENAEIVYNRNQIIEIIGSRRGKDNPSAIKPRAIDFHITRLRRKLKAEGVHIKSIYGLGYRLELKGPQ